MALLETSKYLQGSVLGSVNPDLASERQTASFSVEKLTALLDGGAEQMRIRRAVGEWPYEAWWGLAQAMPVSRCSAPLCSTVGFVLLGICLSPISLKSGTVELESSLHVNQYDSSAATPAV